MSKSTRTTCPQIRALPLRTAHLCVNCETIYDYLEANGLCPACLCVTNVSLISAVGTLGLDAIELHPLKEKVTEFHPTMQVEGVITGRLIIKGAN